MCEESWAGGQKAARWPGHPPSALQAQRPHLHYEAVPKACPGSVCLKLLVFSLTLGVCYQIVRNEMS